MIYLPISLYLQVLYLITSYIFFRELYKLYHLIKYKNKIILYQFDLRNELFINLILSGFVTIVLLLNCDNSFDFQIRILIFGLYLIHHLLSCPDENYVLEMSNLNIGYGAALWYYKNYLTLFLPHNFIERVKNFESHHKVEVLKKLFILVPHSCVVLKYLDTDETGNIERCQELQKFEKTIAGIKNRPYNITVYHLRTDLCSKKIRMAVEYAQPLKGLYAFKDKKLFTEEEMVKERQLFVQWLQKFLKDENDSYKFCEIVEFNDEKRKVFDVLIEHSCFGNSSYKID